MRAILLKEKKIAWFVCGGLISNKALGGNLNEMVNWNFRLKVSPLMYPLLIKKIAVFLILKLRANTGESEKVSLAGPEPVERPEEAEGTKFSLT